MFARRTPDQSSSTLVLPNTNVPVNRSSTMKISSSIAVKSHTKPTTNPAAALNNPSVMMKLQPQVAQYSVVGLSRQPDMNRSHAVPQLQKSRKDLDITHDLWSTSDNEHPQQLRVRLHQGPVDQPSNEEGPFSAPWQIWKGYGWANMDQSPMELTVPDGPESLGIFDPATLETWLTSLGNVESGRTGGLNGEWASNCQHL
jgi:hypothetical protein